MIITIDKESLKKLVYDSKLSDETRNKLIKQLEKTEKRDISKKQSSALEASKKRSNDTKKKIENAINILRIENRKMSQYAIAKESGCSINTVKKYCPQYNTRKKND